MRWPRRTAFCIPAIGKGVEPTRADATAQETGVPLKITKRGALAFGRR